MSGDANDQGWQELVEASERLRWARTRWQRQAGAINGSAKDAADSLGMKEGTYRAYERAPGASKAIALGHQEAARFGRRFKVNWIWLLNGSGSPFDDQLPPAQERVVQAMSRADEAQQAALADMVERLFGAGRTGTEG